MLIITVESPKIDSPKMGFVFLNNLNSDVVSKNDLLLCFKIKGLTFLLSKEWELKGKKLLCWSKIERGGHGGIVSHRLNLFPMIQICHTGLFHFILFLLLTVSQLGHLPLAGSLLKCLEAWYVKVGRSFATHNLSSPNIQNRRNHWRRTESEINSMRRAPDATAHYNVNFDGLRVITT